MKVKNKTKNNYIPEHCELVDSCEHVLAGHTILISKNNRLIDIKTKSRKQKQNQTVYYDYLYGMYYNN